MLDMHAVAQWDMLHYSLVLSQLASRACTMQAVQMACTLANTQVCSGSKGCGSPNLPGATAAKGSLLIKAIQLRFLSEGVILP